MAQRANGKHQETNHRHARPQSHARWLSKRRLQAARCSATQCFRTVQQRKRSQTARCRGIGDGEASRKLLDDENRPPFSAIRTLRVETPLSCFSAGLPHSPSQNTQSSNSKTSDPLGALLVQIVQTAGIRNRAWVLVASPAAFLDFSGTGVTAARTGLRQLTHPGQ